VTDHEFLAEQQELRGSAAGEVHVFAGDEAVAVNKRKLLVEAELLRLLEKHHAGRRYRPANNHLGAGVADAAQLRNEIGVARRKRLENRFQVAFLGDDLELLGSALPEAAGVGEQSDLLEPLLVEIVGGALQHQIIVDRALEHEAALGNRIDDGARTLG